MLSQSRGTPVERKILTDASVTPRPVLPTFGIHEGVDETAYHADKLSISSSQAKALLYDGPAALRNPKPFGNQDALDTGSVVHALVLGVGDYEVIDFPNYLSKAAKQAREEVRARGGTPVIPRDLERAGAIRDSVYAHPVAREILSVGQAELSLWATDPATGVLMRGRIDWLHDGVNNDLKTSSGLPWAEVFMGAVMRYGYGLQAAWYMKLLWLNGVDPKPPRWIVVTKREPYEVEVLQPAQDLIDYSMTEVDRALALYAQCLETDEWPESAADPPDEYIAHARTVEAVPIEEVAPSRAIA